MHGPTVPVPLSPFSPMPLRVSASSEVSFAACLSLQVLYFPDPGMPDHLAGIYYLIFFPFCRYLGFHLPSHTCPLPQAREIPARLALAYNSYLPNQDLSKPRTVNTMCAVPIMGKFLSLSLYYSFSFSFLLILSFSPSLFTSVYLSLPFIFI